jgi:hypothetical protein
MWVLVIIAVFQSPDLDQNIFPVTRHQMQSYPTEAACRLDQKAQIKAFYESLPTQPVVFGGTCVEITGPVGAPT